MDRFYDRQGKPIPMEKWAELFSDEEYQRVALTVGCGRRVSTVWMGINHNFVDKGPPLIFESMVFANDETNELDYVRYSTEEEALKGHELLSSGHAHILDRIVKKLEDDDAAVDDSG